MSMNFTVTGEIVTIMLGIDDVAAAAENIQFQ